MALFNIRRVCASSAVRLTATDVTGSLLPAPCESRAPEPSNVWGADLKQHHYRGPLRLRAWATQGRRPWAGSPRR